MAIEASLISERTDVTGLSTYRLTQANGLRDGLDSLLRDLVAAPEYLHLTMALESHPPTHPGAIANVKSVLSVECSRAGEEDLLGAVSGLNTPPPAKQTFATWDARR